MAKKAEYQLLSSVNEGILEIVIIGEVTAGTIKNVDEEIHTLLKTTESRVILIDICAVSGRLGTAESYFHVQNYSPEMQRADIALVDLEEYADLQSNPRKTRLADTGVIPTIKEDRKDERKTWGC